MPHKLCLFACALLLALSGTACANSKHEIKIAGMHTNMHYNAEGGDVLGDEVFVVFSNRGYYVVFQGSEGEPEVPVVIPARVDGNSISFTLPPADPRGAFRGTISNTGLTGVFSGTGHTIHLKRAASYWQ